MVTKKVINAIKKHKMIHSGGHIVLGLSGGPDSVCLFHVLKNLQDEMNFILYAVHINHGLRPGDADRDQRYVEALCAKEGVICIPLLYDCKEVAKQTGLTEEAAGRKIRYSAFWEVANSLINNGIAADRVKIAVAQNANDQAETVLIRMLRGTGIDGLAGIAYTRNEKDIQVIRPLLDVSREEIETYCADNNLRPRIDKTNLEAIYTRNKIRLELIPYLEKNFNKNMVETLIRLSKNAREDKEYLWQITAQVCQWAKVAPNCYDREKLKKVPRAIRNRLIMGAFEEIGLTQDISTAHLNAAEQLIMEGTVSKTIDLPLDHAITIKYEGILFHKRQDVNPERRIMELYVHIILPGEKIPSDCAIFDWDKVLAVHKRPVLSLRTRQPGDFISLKVGRKKLQDFMTDQKIPSQFRDNIPVVAIGKEILWIMADENNGLKRSRYSEKYKLDTTTKRALALETICEI